jgi:hypothetical protein
MHFKNKNSLKLSRLIGVEFVTVRKTVAPRVTLSTSQKFILFFCFIIYYRIEVIFQIKSVNLWTPIDIEATSFAR